MERGLACSEGAVSTLTAAVASVERIRFFQGNVGSGTKFHGKPSVVVVVVAVGMDVGGRGVMESCCRCGVGVAYCLRPVWVVFPSFTLLPFSPSLRLLCVVVERITFGSSDLWPHDRDGQGAILFD